MTIPVTMPVTLSANLTKGLRRLGGTMAGVLGAALIFSHTSVYAAEGGSSHYFPGAYGNLLVAVAPDPGAVLQSLNLFYSGSVDRSVLQGEVQVELEADAAISMLQALYIWDIPDSEARFAVGALVPVGYSKLEASASAGQLNRAFEEDRTAFGDSSIIPASIYWSTGNFHFNAYELITMPVGQYDKDNLVNLGRNYWSFDSVLAGTWFDPALKTEISMVAGLMLNTRNEDTDYKTGTEFHLDAAANYFITPTFAAGLRGYYYKQLTDDSGSGALLGGFRGESAGLGLGFSWIPKSAGGKLAITASWLHDIHAENKLKGDYGSLSIGFSF